MLIQTYDISLSLKDIIPGSIYFDSYFHYAIMFSNPQSDIIFGIPSHKFNSYYFVLPKLIFSKLIYLHADLFCLEYGLQNCVYNSNASISFLKMYFHYYFF